MAPGPLLDTGIARPRCSSKRNTEDDPHDYRLATKKAKHYGRSKHSSNLSNRDLWDAIPTAKTAKRKTDDVPPGPIHATKKFKTQQTKRKVEVDFQSVAKLWQESPYAKRVEQLQGDEPGVPAPDSCYTFDYGALPLEIVLTISRCLDTSTLSSLTLTCKSLHVSLGSVLDRRKASSELITAVDRSNREDARRLLAFGADPDTRKSGCPILHMAVSSHSDDSAAIVRNLLASGCDPNARDQNGYTALYLAVLAGNTTTRCHYTQKVGWLLERLERTDLNATNTEMLWTPLHYATYTRNKELVKLLCDNGANPNERDATGSTALHIARRYRSHDGELRRLLCSLGADQEAKDFLGLRPRSYHYLLNRKAFTDIVGDIADFVLYNVVRRTSVDFEL